MNSPLFASTSLGLARGTTTSTGSSSHEPAAGSPLFGAATFTLATGSSSWAHELAAYRRVSVLSLSCRCYITPHPYILLTYELRPAQWAQARTPQQHAARTRPPTRGARPRTLTHRTGATHSPASLILTDQHPPLTAGSHIP